MKRIKQTLAAGFLAFAALNQAKAEVSPLSYGVKGFGSMSGLMGAEEFKINDKKANAKLFDFGTLWGGGGLHGEYAFTNYLGVALDLTYVMTGGNLVGEKPPVPATPPADPATPEAKAPTASMYFHSIVVPISLCIYPMAREEDEGILKAFIGATVSYSFMKTVENGDKKLELGDKKGELSGLDFGAHLGVAYEWVNGFSVESQYTMNFMNRFNIAADKKLTAFDGEAGSAAVTDLKTAKTHSVVLGMGYNLATLFAE
ncbi:MAG: PorT family protein [Amoebophilaceae bacterium]|nr:PorT family protein [Amoebophilaceae bacterium]